MEKPRGKLTGADTNTKAFKSIADLEFIPDSMEQIQALGDTTGYRKELHLAFEIALERVNRKSRKIVG